MDSNKWIDEIVQEARVLITGEASEQTLSSLGFALAKRHASLKENSFVLILTLSNLEAVAVENIDEIPDHSGPASGPPLLITESKCSISKPGAGHGDGSELDRIWFKYLDSAHDLPWYLNNVQQWSKHTTITKPTLVVVDGVIDLREQDMAWSFLLFKLLDEAASFLNAQALIISPVSAQHCPHLSYSHFFPTCLTLQSYSHDSFQLFLQEPHSLSSSDQLDNNKRRRYLGDLKKQGNFLLFNRHQSPSPLATITGEAFNHLAPRQ